MSNDSFTHASPFTFFCKYWGFCNSQPLMIRFQMSLHFTTAYLICFHLKLPKKVFLQYQNNCCLQTVQNSRLWKQILQQKIIFHL